MRVPLSWLREFVDVELTPEQLAERLTLLGMEVKHIERWGADWENVVTGELLTVERHPRADRLSPHDGDARRRRRAAVDRLRRHEHRPRPAHPGGAARRGPARQPPHRARREDGRRLQRHAVLGRGAAADRRRRRDPHPAGRHAARASRSSTSTATSCSTWTSSRTAATRCRSSGLAREVAAATGQQVRVPEIVVEEGSGPSTAERLAVDVRDPDLCTAVRRPLGERRDRRPVAGRTSRCGSSPPASARSPTSWTPRTT